MSFLNATLIIGTIAAAVPLVLHLIAQREPRKVVFPSIVFLTQKFETNRTRMRVRRFWLLAMRVAAVVALALALARPVIARAVSVTWISIGFIVLAAVILLVMASIALLRQTAASADGSKRVGFGLIVAAVGLLLAAAILAGITVASGPRVTGDEDSPVALAIVIDNSPTSGWKAADGPRIDQMKQIAAWVISRLPRTSVVGVIDRSGGPAAFSLDIAGAISNVEKLKPIFLVEPIESRIDAACRLARTSSLPNRHVLVLTDLARGTWNPSEESSLPNILQADPALSLTVFDVGKPRGFNQSLSLPKIADVTPPRRTPTALTVAVTSRHYGALGQQESQSQPPADETQTPSDAVKVSEQTEPEDWQSSSDMATAVVELQISQTDAGLPIVRDGKVVYPEWKGVDRTTAKVRSGDTVEVLLTVPGLEVGTHHGRIQIVGDDALDTDNQRYFTLHVLPPSKVLLADRVKAHGDVIENAIATTTNGTTTDDSEFIVERIAIDDVPVARLDDYDAVVLLGASLETLGDSSVDRYLREGGNLLADLGPDIEDPPDQTVSWMPRCIRRWRVPQPGTFLEVDAANHPVVETLGADTPWDRFPIHQYWQLETVPDDAVLMRMASTSHAALIERWIHRSVAAVPSEKQSNPDSQESDQGGRALVLATPLVALSPQSRRWNQLFGNDPWPAWLLSRQAIEYLCGRNERRGTANLGQIANIDIQAAEKPTRLQLFPPEGTPPIPLDVEGPQTRVVVTDVRLPGIHWIKGSSKRVNAGAGFSANFADDLIDPRPIDQEQLTQIIGESDFQCVTERDSIELTQVDSAQRLSLTSPAMLLALILFLLEQVLGNRFFRQSPMPK